LRDRLLKALDAKSWAKTSHFREYIGCQLEELRLYLEGLFSPEMTWENHGKIWQIDHIIPLGSAETDEQMYKLAHFSNLKPILIEDHKIKSKIDTENIMKKKGNKL
jgi:hypothetical protein